MSSPGGVEAGAQCEGLFLVREREKARDLPENPPHQVRVLSVFRRQAATFLRQAEGNGHRERRSAGTGVPQIGVLTRPDLKVGGSPEIYGTSPDI